MGISDKDIKKLWGLSAGRCNYPGCGLECIKFCDQCDPTVIGQMAHIIAKSPRGPRSSDLGGLDTYENLILLCPTHHTLIDKGPIEKFSAEVLLAWKNNHESEISRALVAPSFADKKNLCLAIKPILDENKHIWSTFGPDSSIARKNPVSTAALIWTLRKLDTIIPNNKKLITMLRRNFDIFSFEENQFCNAFITHAKAFEISAYERQDSDAVPKFPKEFEKIISENIGYV